MLGLALLLALALAVPATAQQGLHDAETVTASRDRVLDDSRYQTAKPEPETPVVPDPDRWIPPPWLVEAILWAFGAVAAALILYFLLGLARDMLQGRRSLGQGTAQPAQEARVATVPPRQREAEQRTLAEADALAGQDRFSEAIHLLLLVALERLRRELGPRLAPAMTGREVLRLSALPGAAAAPLKRMVALSEINHFGGRQAGAPDYHRCREDFLRFSGLEGEPA